MLPFLDAARVRALLRMEDLIPAIEQALVAFSAGEVAQPPRQVLRVPGQEAHAATLMAAGEGIGLGMKLVTFHPGNAARGLPTHHGVILLVRPDTGEPLALMDAGLITAMRTAAASAVATRVLARPDAAVLAILGTGAQAHAHAEALPLVRRFREIRVWGRTPAHARLLAEEIGAVAVPSAEAAVRGADVVVTATAAATPVLQGAWLGPRAHVNAIGWSGPEGRELDEEAMRGAFVVADSREAVLREAGDVRLSGAPVGAELGEVLAGRVAVPAGRTVFESVGLAVQDIVAAQRVWQAHRAG